MKKIGLVLAGGGGKGAYQIGVAKALREYGVDQNIQAIAGTSVGALNSLLLAQGDIQLAEKVWLTISPEKILTMDPNRWLTGAKKRWPSRVFSIVDSLSTQLIEHGWFSRDGLLDIIRENVNLSYISNLNIPIFSTCLHAGSLKATYFKINGSAHERIESILLASSAIPFIFDPVEIDGELYWDGGVPLPAADNIPIQPLYDEGCEVIITVHLSRDRFIDHSQFPHAQIIEIVPQEDQGGFIKGTLDFSPLGAERRMLQGYEDAKRILQPIFDMMMVQRNIQITLNDMREDETEFRIQRARLVNEREVLKQDLVQYIKR
ncbi:patatin-like phospholipase family protein [Bacillus sp. 1P10SD]|uniref:patatin-like phospholipase family protein n=1 Tax=Bacillus sp. 1P10SD TaxID=3132265 RepID=UPI0039A580A9